jgi:sec-independent protein translocase protein TatC
MSFGSNRGNGLVGNAAAAVSAGLSRREDGEDLFAHTRMSLGDHIEELRRHMIKALIGFFIAMIIGFFISKPIVEQIDRPVEQALMRMYEARIEKAREKYKENSDEAMIAANKPQNIHVKIQPKEWAAAFGQPAEALSDQPKELEMTILPVEVYFTQAQAIQLIGRPPKLSALSVTEVFMVYLKVAMYSGIVLSSPWIFYQMWMFIAAGLYPHERRYVHMYMPISLGLFLAGVALCWFVVLPYGIDYLLGWNEYMGIEADLRLNEWLGFAIMMPVIFGLAFQTPLIMFFLERLGIVDVTFYTKHRKMAIFILALAGGLLSVAPDLGSMLMLGAPMIALYEVGILMCKYMPRHKVDDLDVPQSEELVEV